MSQDNQIADFSDLFVDEPQKQEQKVEIGEDELDELEDFMNELLWLTFWVTDF